VTLLFVAGIGGFLSALLLTPASRFLAFRLGVVAHPTQDRWHRETIPLFGGIALWAGWSVTVLALGLLRVPFVPVLFGGATFLFVVGIVDDVRPLGPQTKFIIQVLVASGMVAMGLQLHLTKAPVVDLLFTLFWIVAVTNAFNLLDNMDGLAAGIATIAATFRLVFFLVDGNLEGALLCAALAGVALGFLCYNFSPASIFMGDAGSLFLGFTVSGLSLIGGYPYSRSTFSVLLLPALILLVPLFDTSLVTVARIIAGRRVSQGGRDHTSHRLVALGLSERRAVLLLYAVAVTSGILALLSYRFGLSKSVVLIGLMLVGLGLFAVLLGRLKVYPENASPPADTAGFVRVITEFQHKRQVATAVIDLTLVVLAYYAAHLLRYEDAFRPDDPTFLRALPVFIICQMSSFALFRTYQGVWRYTGIFDLVRLGKAAMAGTGLAIIALFVAFDLRGHSRAVLILDGLLLVMFVGGSRILFRALSEWLRPRPAYRRPVVIYGAGDGGVLALREILNNPGLGRLPVGFIDDDRSKWNSVVQGVPVLGGLTRLPDVLDRYGVTEVILAASLLSHNREELERVCLNAEVPIVRATMRLE